MDRLTALRSEREACLRFCRQLSEPWEKSPLGITGDHDYATRFLGSLRII